VDPLPLSGPSAGLADPLRQAQPPRPALPPQASSDGLLRWTEAARNGRLAAPEQAVKRLCDAASAKRCHSHLTVGGLN